MKNSSSLHDMTGTEVPVLPKVGDRFRISKTIYRQANRVSNACAQRVHIRNGDVLQVMSVYSAPAEGKWPAINSIQLKQVGKLRGNTMLATPESLARDFSPATLNA